MGPEAQLFAAILPSIIAMFNPGGSKGETKSDYGKGQLGLIDEAIGNIKGKGGGAGSDITQNPIYQQGNDWLMSMFNDPEFFKSFEAPLQRQFQEETVPGLANRFASMGSGGSLGSTAFRNQLGREGSNLSTNIAALRGGMMQNAIPQLFQSAQMPISNYQQMLNSILGHPTENNYQGPTNPWSAIAGPALQGYFQNPNNFGGQNNNQQQQAPAKIPGQGAAVY